MSVLNEPSVAAAIVAGGVTAIGSVLVYLSNRSRDRGDAAAKGLTSLLDGVDKYTGRLLQRVVDLEKALKEQGEDCERRIAGVEDEMRSEREKCDRRIAELERRLPPEHWRPLGSD